MNIERYKKAVEIENLSFVYRGANKKALDNVSLEIKEGDFVAWMGHTGAGKSTLAYCLNALIPSFIRGQLSGKALVLGKDISQIFSTNVELEIAFGMENMGMPWEEMKRIVEELLHVVRLEGLEDREPSTLSGGGRSSAWPSPPFWPCTLAF